MAKAGWNLDQFKARAKDSLQHRDEDWTTPAFQKMSQLLHYVDGDYQDPADIHAVAPALGPAKGPLHYLAIPPSLCSGG